MRPPTVGEHNSEIYRDELGLSERELSELAQRESSDAQRSTAKDVKICDFMWVMAGPASTRILADYGATVVRIESPTRVDTARTLQPYHGNQLGPDSSGPVRQLQRRQIRNLARPRQSRGARQWYTICSMGRRRHRVLLSQGDARVGLRLRQLRKVKPDIIMLSSCLMGQTGPFAKIAGFGNMAAAISGFHNLTGWPDRPPAGVRRVHRLRIAALHRYGDSRGARLSPSHRRRPVHRSVAG